MLIQGRMRGISAAIAQMGQLTRTIPLPFVTRLVSVFSFCSGSNLLVAASLPRASVVKAICRQFP